jgi:hypothetical protein
LASPVPAVALRLAHEGVEVFVQDAPGRAAAMHVTQFDTGIQRAFAHGRRGGGSPARGTMRLLAGAWRGFDASSGLAWPHWRGRRLYRLACGVSTWLPLPSTSMRISSLPTAITSPAGRPGPAPCRDRRRDFHGGLVGHDVGHHLVFGDHVADLDEFHQLDLAMPSPMSGILMTCVPIQTSMTRFNAAPTREGPGK